MNKQQHDPYKILGDAIRHLLMYTHIIGKECPLCQAIYILLDAHEAVWKEEQN